MVKMIHLLKTTKFMSNLNDVMERFDMEIIDTVASNVFIILTSFLFLISLIIR